MAVLLLVLGIAASTAVTFLGRRAGRLGLDPAALLLIAVIFAAGVTGAAVAATHAPAALVADLRAAAPVLLFTSLTGAVGTVCYYLALGGGPTGPVATITSLQVVVPVLASVILWKERLGAVQVAGVLLALAAVALLPGGGESDAPSAPGTDTAPAAPPSRRGGVAWKAMALASLVLLGLANASFKYKQLHLPQVADAVYLAAYWALCVPLLGTYLAARRRAIPARAWPMGLALGVLLLGANFGVVYPLRTLGATLVYLATLGGPPLLAVLVSMTVLGERYPLRVRVALAAGLLGLCLIALK